jgi:hypothetical protein
MNTNLKKALLIFGGGFILFWAFKKIKPIGGSVKSKKSEESKSLSDSDKKNAAIVLTAYKDAKKAGESKAFLDEMNSEFAKEYQLRVYTDKGTGKLFVADLDGNKVI